MKKPFEGSELAMFVGRRILELKSRKSQAEIAADAGYVNQNMITMIKQGATKVALDRIPALAVALEVDAAFLMRRALVQAVGRDATDAILEAFGEPVSENELGWIVAIREESSDRNPKITTRSRAAIRSIFQQ